MPGAAIGDPGPHSIWRQDEESWCPVHWGPEGSGRLKAETSSLEGSNGRSRPQRGMGPWDWKKEVSIDRGMHKEDTHITMEYY